MAIHEVVRLSVEESRRSASRTSTVATLCAVPEVGGERLEAFCARAVRVTALHAHECTGRRGSDACGGPGDEGAPRGEGLVGVDMGGECTDGRAIAPGPREMRVSEGGAASAP